MNSKQEDFRTVSIAPSAMLQSEWNTALGEAATAFVKTWNESMLNASNKLTVSEFLKINRIGEGEPGRPRDLREWFARFKSSLICVYGEPS